MGTVYTQPRRKMGFDILIYNTTGTLIGFYRVHSHGPVVSTTTPSYHHTISTRAQQKSNTTFSHYVSYSTSLASFRSPAWPNTMPLPTVGWRPAAWPYLRATVELVSVSQTFTSPLDPAPENAQSYKPSICCQKPWTTHFYLKHHRKYSLGKTTPQRNQGMRNRWHCAVQRCNRNWIVDTKSWRSWAWLLVYAAEHDVIAETRRKKSCPTTRIVWTRASGSWYNTPWSTPGTVAKQHWILQKEILCGWVEHTYREHILASKKGASLQKPMENIAPTCKFHITQGRHPY